VHASLAGGAGRYAEALASARRELPYTHELGHAMVGISSRAELKTALAGID
jgi:hypothetical protein